MNPLVSVIIPVYNVQDYIHESIKSVCNQSYGNIEIILVDDGTKDNSIEIANNVLIRSGKKFRIVHQKNSGLPAARNAGMDIAEGKYVCFIDSDDIATRDHIKNTVSVLNKSRCSVGYSDFELTSLDNRYGNTSEYEGSEYLDKHKLFSLFSDRTIKIHCCSLVISMDLIKTHNLRFNEKLRYGEDVEFMWRLFSITEGIEHIKQVTYKYLMRDNSIMSSPSFDKWKVFINEFDKTMKYLSIKYPENCLIYSYVYCRTMFGLLHTVAKNTDWDAFNIFAVLINWQEVRWCLLKRGKMKTKLVSMLLFNRKLFYIVAHKN